VDPDLRFWTVARWPDTFHWPTDQEAARQPFLAMKRPKFMKRAVWLAGLLLALAVTACSSGSGAIFTVSHQGQTY
jgi:hypothetical protein